MSTTDIYIPPGAEQMSTIKFPQIRLALQGASKTGKTYSALTFPNPVVIDIDNGLVAHTHRTDVLRLPFNDNAWISTWFKHDKNKVKFPCRDAIKQWLSTEALKLTDKQTLIIDSWTTLQDAFDAQADPSIEPVYTSNNSINEFAFWEKKLDFSREVMNSLKSLKCHVIVTFHEQDIRNASGQLIGKVEPAMQGKFQKKLGLYFTDWFRTIAKSKIDPTDKEGKKVIDTSYFWQTKGDNEVNLGSRLKGQPLLVEPHFKIFEQYFSQNTTNNKTTVT